MHLLQLNEEKWKEDEKERNEKGFYTWPFLTPRLLLYDSVVNTSATTAFLECILSKGFFFIVINRNCNNFFMAL